MPDPTGTTNPFPIKHFWAAAALLSIAIIAGLIIHGWLSQRGVDRQTVEQIIQQSLPQHQQNEQQVQQGQADAELARQREADNQKLLAATLAAIAAQKGQPVQPVDYAKIDQMIATHLNVNQNQVHTSTDASGQAVTVVPTQQYRDFQLQCDANKAGLDSCLQSVNNAKAESAGKDTQIAALMADNTLLKQDNKKLQDVANGGSFWKRLARNAKYSICGSGGTASGIAIAEGPGDAKTGALVGGGVFGFCALMMRGQNGRNLRSTPTTGVPNPGR